MIDPEHTRVIRITGYGDLTEAEWEAVQPREIATLIPVPGMPDLFVGETPDEEDHSASFHDFLLAQPDLAKAGDGLVAGFVAAQPESTIYTKELCDIRLDLYGLSSLSPEDVEHIRAPMADGTISRHTAEVLVELTAHLYEDWLGGHRVAVNCQAGLNRSSLSAALILMHHGYTADEAIDLIRTERSDLCLVNKHFVDFLQMNESFIHGYRASLAAVEA
jgi:hypothetical protein